MITGVGSKEEASTGGLPQGHAPREILKVGSSEM